jgi:hypothetical protein
MNFSPRRPGQTEHRSNGQQSTHHNPISGLKEVSPIRTTPVEDQKRSTKQQGKSEFDRQ